MRRTLLALAFLLAAGGLRSDDRPPDPSDPHSPEPPDITHEERVRRRAEVLRQIRTENQREADRIAELKRQHGEAEAAARADPTRESLRRLAHLSCQVPEAIPAAADLLAGLLSHASADVRRDALCILAGTLRDKRAALPLKKALTTETDPVALRELVQALGGLITDPADGPDRKATLDFLLSRREDPVFAWVFAEPPPIPPLKPFPAPPMDFPPDPALEKQVRALGTADLEERDAALKGILALGAKEPDRVLALLPASHEDLEIQDRLQTLRRRIPWEAHRMQALARFPDDPKMRDLIERAFAATGPGVGLQIAQSALANHRERIAEAVLPLLSHRDPHAVASAIQGLALLRPPPPPERFIRFLTHPDAAVRKAALLALSGRGSRAAAPARPELYGTLADPDEAVRSIALQVLSPSSGAAAAPRFARLLADPSESVRMDAAEALWRIWTQAAFTQPLGNILEKGPRETFSAVAQALSQLHPSREIRDVRKWWKASRENPDFREPASPEAGEKR